jgi:triosephosphate isomerase
MRQQIAAANWKMNLTLQQGEELIDKVLNAGLTLKEQQSVLFAVPFPYLPMTRQKLGGKPGYFACAQNCYDKKSGAYTGEVSAEMLKSIGIAYAVLGHSERREYFKETNEMLASKIDLCLENGIRPVFCCGESLHVRESGNQNRFVEIQLRESLFHLTPEDLKKIIIAYEPIWAIGTGKTATTAQAQDMHAYLRLVLQDHYGKELADSMPILYGGSVKVSNAHELFSSPDVDGGLIGGASLVAEDFIEIIRSLK